MTKKATWSGYRGDGKPVIPCTPNLSTRVRANGSAAPRTPTDYMCKGTNLSSSPRKMLRHLRKELLASLKFPNYGTSDYFSMLYSKDRNDFIETAYQERDLDLLLVFKDFKDSHHMKDIVNAVKALKELGYDAAHGVITSEHIDTFKDVSTSVQAFDSTYFINSYDEYMDGNDSLAERCFAIGTIALIGKAQEAAVKSILKEREITDPVEVRKLVDEMLVDSYALGSGVL